MSGGRNALNATAPDGFRFPALSPARVVKAVVMAGRFSFPARRRFAAVLVLGMLAFYGAQLIAQQAVAPATSGERMQGHELALFAGLFAPLFTVFLAVAYRLVPMGLGDIGLRCPKRWQPDLLLGMAVGVLWPALEFSLLIPVTGGGARSDVIASRQLAGDSLAALLAALFLGAVAGGYGEELFFRGHIITVLERLLPARWGIAAGSLVSVTWFALGHAYQGLAGILDTGFFALLMVLLFVWRRSLLAPIVAHGLNNMLLLVGLYLWY